MPVPKPEKKWYELPGVYDPEQAGQLPDKATSSVAGTKLPDSGPKTAGIPPTQPEVPPAAANIADGKKQGVTGDAESASPVDLAGRSVPSQPGNPADSGAAGAAPTVATNATGRKKYASTSTGITVRVTPEQDQLIEHQKEFHGGSKAAVLLDSLLNNGKVPEVNKQLRDDFRELLRTINGLIERTNQNELPAELKPLLARISDQIIQVRQDLIKPRKPDATALALARMSKDIEIIKKQYATLLEILAQKGTQ